MGKTIKKTTFAKKVFKKKKAHAYYKDTERLRKGTFQAALKSVLKSSSGRKDIAFNEAGRLAKKHMDTVPLKERAGYPIVRAKGSVDPKNWVSGKGVKVMVDFARYAGLPDDWGQGVKTTIATSHSKPGGAGGTYTVFVAPDGKLFYHKGPAEEYAKKKFSIEAGRKGQEHAKELMAIQARRFAFDFEAQAVVKVDPDESLFKVLNPRERKYLPSKKEFHVGIVSARRAQSHEGIVDIARVQSAFTQAGVTPTWYVDAGSLKDYKALGLNAKVGGKLTAARNMALKDAKKAGKVCVQCSDDISAWEYRVGKQATERTDEAANAAYDASKRLIVSPVAAARFMLAKMRGAPEKKKPKLGGVYMLSSCSRTFGCGTGPFVRKSFILGDFFVVDRGSKCLFDPKMTLKEDYDFTCSHLKENGSVMRCNRLTLVVKHYSNSGGAVATRDKKGVEERKNIAILKRKWPRVFHDNPKRKNEVVMRWKKDLEEDFDDDREE
jgi:hypothetical protein